MARILKVALWAVAITAVLLVLAIQFTIGWRPFFGPRTRAVTQRTYERTPERLARGRYLAEDVSGCEFCHSPHDWTQRALPIPAGEIGAGEIFPLKDLPGRVVAPNLTSDPQTGLGNWTDDEIARAIREGVDRDGRTLFPLMPYEHFRQMSDEDLASVIVYVRSLAPVHSALPKTQIIFPVRYLMRSTPQPLTSPVSPPDSSTPETRGAYLVQMAGCSDCHTPQQNGAPMRGLDFAGGLILEGPFGRVASANITPDPTGIPYYDAPLFLQAMRTGSVKARPLSPIMPWDMYGKMTDGDLNDIFSYLKTLRPVHHHVDNTEPAVLCPICKSVHGGASSN